MNTDELIRKILDGAIEQQLAGRTRLGIPAKDMARYDIGDVMTRCEKGMHLVGIEAEVEQEMRKRKGANGRVYEGTPVPWEAFGKVQRDMTAGVFGQGGATVGTDVDSTVIPLLRNRARTVGLGVYVLDGLTANLAMPRQTSPSNPQFVSETGPVAPSNVTLDQEIMSPKRVSVALKYSRQWMLQSSVSVKQFLANDMGAQIGLAIDRVVLNGQGSGDEPLGVMNTPGIQQIVFGGTATWSKVLAFEQAIAAMNADEANGKFAYLTTPNTRSRWKQIPQQGVGQSTTYPIFLWGKRTQPGEPGDGDVNGYLAAVSNQVPNDQVLYGNFASSILGVWGDGIDLLINPYTFDVEGQVQATMNMFIDHITRHPQSYCMSADSGAQ